jgi:tetratricopeptide (TPR) repeat protein
MLRFLCVIVALLAPGGACLSQAVPNADAQADFAAHIQKAKQHLDEKRPDRAIPELEAAATIAPNSVETQANLGVLLYFQNRIAEAIPHLRVATENQPALSKIQGLLGLAEVHVGDVVRGRKDLEVAFPLVTEQNFKKEVGLELVSLDTQSGDLEEASVIVAQLRKAAPDNPEILYAAYRTYAALSGESMLALSLAAPDSAQMHQLMAHEDIRQGNTNSAVEQFRKAIAIDPHLPGIYFELAELLRSSQDTGVKKEAEDAYRAALKENPQDEKTILRLAEIDAEKGDVQRASGEYTKAIELQPADGEAKLGLAKALIEMNQTDKALKLLEEAVQLEPTNATAHYRLGSVYRKIGRTDDAKREMELYKKFKDLKEKLRSLYKELQVQPQEISADEPDQK